MTQTLLRIDSSARTEGSVTRALADSVAERLAPSTIITRDVATPLPFLDAAWLGANFTPGDQRSEAQRETLALSDTLIDEIKQADTLLISVPVYNFGIPASLKAWIDLITRAGETFQYTETGPVGLLEGKRAILVMASGGTPAGSPMDYCTPYLKFVLGFIGITDVQIVAADQQAIDAEASTAKAKAEIDTLAA